MSRRLILEDAEKDAHHHIQSTVHKIENLLISAQKQPENLAYFFEHSLIENDKLNDFLLFMVESNDEIFGSCIAFEPNTYNTNSKYYAPYYFKSGDSVSNKSFSDSTYNYFEMDWYKLPKDKGALWSNPYFDKGGGNIIMSTYSVPFFRINNGNKDFWGVVTADVSLIWLDSLMRSLEIYENGYAFLLSETGIVLSHPKAHLILKQTIFSVADNYNLPELQQIGEKMTAGETNFIPYKSMVLNGKCRLYYAPIPINNWSIGLVFPEKELFAGLNNLATWLLIIGGLSLIALLFLIIIISKNFTKPIRLLVTATQKIGSGDFNVDLPQNNSKDEISQLTSSFANMQLQLNNYIQNLKETTTEKNKIESELKIAHDIQQGMIPKIFPPPPHREDLDIYAILNPAKEVGGDFYDFFYIGEHKLAFAIGDVSGKGVPASLFMAITVTLLRAKSQKDRSVAEIVERVNFELCKDNSNSMFVTFFMGIINLQSGEIDYCNAGHNYPYIIKQTGKLICLDKTHGTPLGLFKNTKYKFSKLNLKEDEILIHYTDGITEAMNKNNEMFDEQRLENTLSKFDNKKPVKQLVNTLINKTYNFANGAPQSDDITILALSYKPAKNLIEQKLEKITITNSLDELKKVTTFLQKIAKENKFSNDLLYEMEVVLEEIIVNIINYAYDDDNQHKIIIELIIGVNLQVIIRDDGKKFNILKALPPENLNSSLENIKEGGLGIHFIKTIMDKIEYERKNNNNILMLMKQIKVKE